MLQIDVTPYASDALEDAMKLAQVKALNSFSFSDCLNYLNYAWRDIYDRMAMIDDGYYGVNVQLTEELTRLPDFVRSTVMVYAAQSPVGHNREIFRCMDNAEMTGSGLYRISGNDLWCPDVKRRTVWLYYVPSCSQLFFTHHNRDPKLLDECAVTRDDIYGVFRLVGVDRDHKEIDIKAASRDDLANAVEWRMVHRGTGEKEDITEYLLHEPEDADDGEWKLVYVSCDWPYIFVTYENTITLEHVSGFYDKQDFGWNCYNPFAYTGRKSDVEYLECRWNDKTGMGVVVKDYADKERIKELGWTPDSRLRYPKPEMYRYLVARLADKFSAMNESNIMGVQKELTEAKYAFEAFFDRDKSAWKRINNVNVTTVGDWL